MIITDSYVVLNLPKTGSTFVRKCLKRVYHYYLRRALRPVYLDHVFKDKFEVYYWEDIVKKNIGIKVIDEHGHYVQIPFEHRDKEIVSVIRHPYTRYISGYYFGHWKKQPLGNIAEIKKIYPGFPDLDFVDYLKYLTQCYSQVAFPKFTQEVKLGFETIQFILFFAKEPQKTFLKVNKDVDKYLQEKKYIADFADVTFLHTENLNREFYEFLQKHGLTKARINFILNKKAVNKTKKSKAGYDRLLTAEVCRYINDMDKFIFTLFPEYKMKI